MKNFFDSIARWWNDDKLFETTISKQDPRMYLVLREDLAYKYIQGGHALAQFGLEHPLEFNEWNNEFLICLSVFNGLALDEVVHQLIDEVPLDSVVDRTPSIFFEPDLKSELPTAIAIFENGDGYVSNALKKLRLATK